MRERNERGARDGQEEELAWGREVVGWLGLNPLPLLFFLVLQVAIFSLCTIVNARATCQGLLDTANDFLEHLFEHALCT